MATTGMITQRLPPEPPSLPMLPNDLHRSARPATASGDPLVVAFCAAWCNTCDEFRVTFDSLAAERTDARFVWLDIEDDADVVGDIDIENFPTIAVFVAGRLLHVGVSLPQRAIVARLIDSLNATSRTVGDQDAVAGLPKRLGDAGRSA